MKRTSPIRKEVSETSGCNGLVIPATTTELAGPGEELNKKENIMPVNTVTVTKKIAKVAYKVSYPDPEKVSLSTEQIAKAVKAFFTVQTRYLLSQDVKNEVATIEANKEMLQAMIEMGAKYGAPPEVAMEKALEYLKGKNPNFRVEVTSEYSYDLDAIFQKSDSETEDDSDTEGETGAENPETTA